ncbi:MAG: hypothetical protein LQ342_001165 [Letrouitia transgressa]|nr:MAG: hypothetical protein LQ342_001165 [Letrouitia transgressa]
MYWQWVTGAVAAVLAAYFASEFGNGLTVFTDFVQVVYPLPYVNRMYEPTPASEAVKHDRVQANVTTTKTTPFATPKEDDGADTAKETTYKPTPPNLLLPRWRGFLTLFCNEVLQLITALVILEGRIFLFLQQRLHLLVPLPGKGIETNSTGLKIRHLRKRLAASKMQQLAEIASNAREERDSLKLALEEKLDQARREKDTDTVLLKTVRNERDKLVKELRGLKEQITRLERERDEERLEYKRQTLELDAALRANTSLCEEIISLRNEEERRVKEAAEQRATIDALVERGKAFPEEELAKERAELRAIIDALDERGKAFPEEKAVEDKGKDGR